MHLLNAKTITLEEFFENQAPPYATLSHTWGTEEVSFQDIQGPREVYEERKGHEKIKRTCKQALEDGLQYVWVDTCCINKTSSAELSEAINSMFRWYEKAHTCYAFLVDVSPHLHDQQATFFRSRWFKRGWTLQELLAPNEVVFFASDWSRIATKTELSGQVSVITGIDEVYLRRSTRVSNGSSASQSNEAGPSRYHSVSDSDDSEALLPLSIHHASAAQKMSWASSRETTRTEDMAYCLLGVFGVSMPLIYGEGTKAFTRLQEEIIRRSNDQSLFAWNSQIPRQDHQNATDDFCNNGHWRTRRETAFLAPSPAAFSESASIIPLEVDRRCSQFSLTNKGLHIQLPMSLAVDPYALLQCQSKDDPMTLVAIPVNINQGSACERAQGSIRFADYRNWGGWPMRQNHFSIERQPDEGRRPPLKRGVFIRNIPESFSIEQCMLPRKQRDVSKYIPLQPAGNSRKSEMLSLLASEDMKMKIAVYFKVTDIFVSSEDILMFSKEVSLARLPCHFTSHELETESYGFPWSNYIAMGDGILYATAKHIFIAGESVFIIDIRSLPSYPYVFLFRLQDWISGLISGYLGDIINWETTFLDVPSQFTSLFFYLFMAAHGSLPFIASNPYLAERLRLAGLFACPRTFMAVHVLWCLLEALLLLKVNCSPTFGPTLDRRVQIVFVFISALGPFVYGDGPKSLSTVYMLFFSFAFYAFFLTMSFTVYEESRFYNALQRPLLSLLTFRTLAFLYILALVSVSSLASFSTLINCLYYTYILFSHVFLFYNYFHNIRT